MLTVHYTDGNTEFYDDVEEAADGISETVVGCDFAVGVEKIDSDDGKRYVYSFTVNVREA